MCFIVLSVPAKMGIVNMVLYRLCSACAMVRPGCFAMVPHGPAHSHSKAASDSRIVSEGSEPSAVIAV